MASRREDLHDILLTLCDNVYFQPPDNITLSYPCIVYKQDRVKAFKANDNAYIIHDGYTVTIISKTPGSGLKHDILHTFSHSSYDRYFVSDSLNHDVLVVYY